MKKAFSWIKENKYLLAVAIIAFFQLNYYLGSDYIGIEHADTVSYVNHSFALADLGARPPLYPFLIKICEIVVGVHRSYFAVCMIQILVSLISIYYFYKTCNMAFNNDAVALLVTIFYGCNPALMYWNNCIMTESLAISITVFFLYNLVMYVGDINDNSKNGMYASVVALIGMLTKPTMVVYLGVCIALLILQFLLCADLRKIVLRVSIVTGACLLFVLAYASVIKKNNGMFNVSDLGPRHALAVSLATQTYKNYPDQELVDEIDLIYANGGRAYAEHAVTSEIMKLFGDDKIARNNGTAAFASFCNKSNPGAKVGFVVNNIKESFVNEAYTLGWLYHKKSNALVNLFGTVHKYIFGVIENRMAWLFIVPVISLIFTAVLWIRNRKCPWLHLGVFGTLLVIIVANYWGSYDSFYRLTVYALPLLYFGVGVEVSEIFSGK